MPYSINQDRCFVSPVCIDEGEPRSDETFITLSSLKLAVRLANDLREAKQCLVVCVYGDHVVHEAAFDLTKLGKLLRFKAPPQILCTGVLTAYLVLCDSDGRVSDIIDSGQVLIFPREAAAEVRALFDKITGNVQQFFRAGNEQQPAEPLLCRALKSLSSLMSTPKAASTAGRAAGAAATASSASSSSCRAGASSSSSGGSSGMPDAATLYAYEHFLLPFVRHWAAVLKTRPTALQASPCSIDAATADTLAIRLLHFMLDNEMWASSVLLLNKFPSVAEQALQAGLQLPGDFCDPIILERLRAALPAQQQPLQDLVLQQQPQQQSPHVLQELRSRSIYSVMSCRDVSPALSDDSQLPSNESSSIESASEILRRLGALQHVRSEQEALEGYLQPPSNLMRTSNPMSASAGGTAEDGDHTYAQQPAAAAEDAPAAIDTSAAQAGSAVSAPVEPAAAAAAANDAADDAGAQPVAAGAPAPAAAAELAVEEKPFGTVPAPADPFAAPTEQAAQQQQDERFRLSSCTSGSGSAVLASSLADGSRTEEMCKQAAAQPAAGQGQSVAAAAAGAEIAADACGGSSSSAVGVCSKQQEGEVGFGDPKASSSSTSRPMPATLTEQLPELVLASVGGFEDGCLEQSYLVYKNHTNAALDVTASVICSGMLLAATTRSFDLEDKDVWQKLAVIIVYGVLFFAPYVFMQLRRQLYLRWREPLLVAARCSSAALLIFVGMRVVAQPDAWVTAVVKTWSLQLQNSFILPSCGQVRVPAAAVIAAVHFVSDWCMLSLGMPLLSALLQSCMVQLCAVLVTLGFEVICRRSFCRRYLRGRLQGSEPREGKKQA